MEKLIKYNPYKPISAQEKPAAQPGAGSPPPGSGSNYSVELYIEELVLYGYAAAERHRIGEALERALTELLTVQELPHLLTSDREAVLLDEGILELPPNATAELIGTRIARALYGGLKK